MRPMNFRRLAGFLAAGILFANPAHADENDDLRRLLRADGQSDESIRKFESAAEVAEEGENVAPLTPFFESRSVSLPFVAGIVALSIDPEAGAEAICAAVESGKGNAPVLLMTLSFDHERTTIGWLIRRLRSDPPDEQKRAAVFSLRVLTTQSHVEPADWAKWWAGDGKNFRPEPVDLEEQQVRMETAAAGLKIDMLRTMLTKLKPADTSKPDALSGVTKLFDGLAETIERGRNLRLSASAKAGDASLAEGNFKKAATEYAAAVAEDPGDIRSRYLRACILMETEETEMAQAEFEDIAEQQPDVTSAKFLAQICARRRQNGAEKMGDAAVAVWRGFRPKPELSISGWDDPVVGTLMGQSMNGGGIFQVPIEKLDLAKHPDNPDLAVGAALLGPNAMRIPSLDQALERSPDAVVAVAARVQSSLRESDKPAVPALLDRLATLDPDNGFPLFLKIAMENQPTREQKRDKRKNPLPPTVITAAAAALQRKKFDSYRILLRAAKMQALRETGHPFQALIATDAPGLQSELFQLMIRLAETAVIDFEAGNDKQGREILGLLQELHRRTVKAKEPMLSQILTESAVGIATKALRTFEEKAGHMDKAAALQRQLDEAKARRSKAAQVDWMAMLFLPVPSLQNELVKRMTEDEVGFNRALAAESQ